MRWRVSGRMAVAMDGVECGKWDDGGRSLAVWRQKVGVMGSQKRAIHRVCQK